MIKSSLTLVLWIMSVFCYYSLDVNVTLDQYEDADFALVLIHEYCPWEMTPISVTDN